MLTAGLLLLGRITANGNAAEAVILPGILVAAGIGLSIVPSTIAATQTVEHKQAGLASGLVNTSRQIGGGLGLALLASIATWYSTRLIGRNASVPDALTEGFRLAYLIAAGFTFLALVCTFWLLPAGETAAPTRIRMRLPAVVAVAVAVFAAFDFAYADHPTPPIGAYTTANTYHYVSEPGLHPPVIKADTSTDRSALAPGYIFITNFYNITSPPMTGQSGPLILNNSLQPVWFHPVPKDVVAADLSYQTYEGQPALAWWQGVISSTGATQSGEWVVVNDHYQTVATLRGTDGWVPTLHSLVITGHDAWVTVNKNLPMNLASYGGSVDGAITDSAVQEYDLQTGKLLHTWDALKHIPLSDSYADTPTNGYPWDAYHVNSIQLVGPHTLLVSMRNTWAVYLIDTSTGKIEWQLGGKHSSFTFGSGASFQWQHDATLTGGSTLTLFDDNCCQISGAGTYLAPNGPSRALTLRLNQAGHTASVVSAYQHGGVSAAYMGSTQVLSNGNTMVGWGEQPYFSEYSKSGKLLLDATLPAPDLSYRAVQVSQWTGIPLTAPSGAARSSGGRTVVYASWNGATQVHSWRVLAGTDPGHLSVVATQAKSGFETAIPVSTGSVFKVQALDASGRVIGTSSVFRRRG
jgi:Arylsulfotransferase (ASST)